MLFINVKRRFLFSKLHMATRVHVFYIQALFAVKILFLFMLHYYSKCFHRRVHRIIKEGIERALNHIRILVDALSRLSFVEKLKMQQLSLVFKIHVQLTHCLSTNKILFSIVLSASFAHFSISTRFIHCIIVFI